MLNKCSLTLITIFLLVSGCSVPQIIVLHDPLSANEHVKLGGIYAGQGKADLALEQYQAAVRVDKKHAQAWALLGDQHYRRGEFDAAGKAYTRVLKLQPENARAGNNLAWVYIQTNKKLRKARELITTALEHAPHLRPYLLDTLGVVLIRQGKPQEAVAVLRESIDLLPKDERALLLEAYGHLAEAYRAAGDEENSADIEGIIRDMQ